MSPSDAVFLFGLCSGMALTEGLRLALRLLLRPSRIAAPAEPTELDLALPPGTGFTGERP